MECILPFIIINVRYIIIYAKYTAKKYNIYLYTQKLDYSS